MKKISNELLKFKKEGPTNEIFGRYVLPHPTIKGYNILVIASDGAGWDHVSVTLWNCQERIPKPVQRCPTWVDMCHVKDIFFDESETVIQYHPPKESYVNLHEYCLHLWRKHDFEMPVPERILVGI